LTQNQAIIAVVVVVVLVVAWVFWPNKNKRADIEVPPAIVQLA
jgi:cbb3-type cytochrome oxidase subunit 3